MAVTGPHTMETQYIRQVLTELRCMWLAHAQATATLPKARAGLQGTTAWALQELRPHQQVERQGVPHAALD